MSSAQELPNTGFSGAIAALAALTMIAIGKVFSSVGRRGAARRKT